MILIQHRYFKLGNCLLAFRFSDAMLFISDTLILFVSVSANDFCPLSTAFKLAHKYVSTLDVPSSSLFTLSLLGTG